VRVNSVKRRLNQGGVSVGTMVFEFNSSGIGRLAAGAGAEFVLYDMEHTGWSVETVRELLATTRAAETVPIVRVPATEYHFIARVLDMGAMGLMMPMVEQARAFVAAAKYPPLGRRGAAFTISHDDYSGGDINEKIRTANSETLLIAQIETGTGLDNVEQIAAVDGIDLVWIGQFDLTNFLGIPGQFEHPQFLAAVERIVAAGRTNGKAAGYMALSPEDAELRLKQGFRCLAYGGDLWIYQQALRSGIAAVRRSIENV
jgi:2-keto-3-deoxy-L-rhamnonate aldolase RhmA